MEENVPVIGVRRVELVELSVTPRHERKDDTWKEGSQSEDQTDILYDQLERGRNRRGRTLGSSSS